MLPGNDQECKLASPTPTEAKGTERINVQKPHDKEGWIQAQTLHAPLSWFGPHHVCKKGDYASFQCSGLLLLVLVAAARLLEGSVHRKL
jgi:hypothetical protein